MSFGSQPTGSRTHCSEMRNCLLSEPARRVKGSPLERFSIRREAGGNLEIPDADQRVELLEGWGFATVPRLRQPL